jgi:hypothetical protein
MVKSVNSWTPVVSVEYNSRAGAGVSFAGDIKLGEYHFD